MKEPRKAPQAASPTDRTITVGTKAETEVAGTGDIDIKVSGPERDAQEAGKAIEKPLLSPLCPLSSFYHTPENLDGTDSCTFQEWTSDERSVKYC